MYQATCPIAIAAFILAIAPSAQAQTEINGRLYISGHDLMAQPIVLWSFSKSNFSGRWPLNLDVVWLGCRSDLPTHTVIMFTGEEAWALNGSTRGWASSRKYKYSLKVNDKDHQVIAVGKEWWWTDETDASLIPDWWNEMHPNSTPKVDIDPLFEFVRKLGCI